MKAPLLVEVKMVVEALNADPILRKILPAEPLVVELIAEDDGRVWVRVDEGGLRVLDDYGGEADVVIRAEAEMLLRILKGEENAVKLFFLGKVSFSGDAVKAYILHERLQEFLKRLSIT